MIDFGISAENFIGNYYEKRIFFRKNALTHCPVGWGDINSALFAWDPNDGLLQIYKEGTISTERYTEKFTDLAIQRKK